MKHLKIRVFSTLQKNGECNDEAKKMVTGSWVTGYVIHAYQFAMPRLKNFRGREERKARKLAVEITNLRAEGVNTAVH